MTRRTRSASRASTRRRDWNGRPSSWPGSPRDVPRSPFLEDENALEEERRLFYVGLTRCKDELYLTYPELRLNAGYGEAFQRPSRFLEELPENLTERWEVARAVARFTPRGKERKRHASTGTSSIRPTSPSSRSGRSERNETLKAMER